MADLKFTADYTDLSKTVDVLIKIGKASNDTATAFGQAARQIVRWQDKFTTEQGRANSAIEKQHQAQQLANKSARESASLFQAQAVEIEKLSQKYKPLYAASMQYEKTLEEINKAHKLGVLNVKQHEAALEQLNKEYTNGTGLFAKYSSQASMRLNQMGVGIQQVGYQVGDFLVQVQSGTNAFVAFGQQATQLVGILPMFADRLGMTATSAMALSAGLGIAIPLVTAIGAAYMRTNESTKTAAETLEELVGLYDRIESTTFETHVNRVQAVEAAWSETLKLARQYDQLDLERTAITARRDLLGSLAPQDVLGKIQEIQDAATAGNRGYTSVEQELLNKLLPVQRQYNALREEALKLDFSSRDALQQSYEQMLKNVGGVESLTEEQRRALKEFADTAGIIDGIKDSIDGVSEAQNNAFEWATELNMAYQEHLENLRQARDDESAMAEAAATFLEMQRESGLLQAELTNLIEKAYKDNLDLSKLNIASGISDAAEVALLLAERLGISVGKARELVNIATNQVTTAADNNGPSLYTADGKIAMPVFAGGTTNDTTTRRSGGKTPAEMLEEYMAKLENETELKRAQVGLSEEAARTLELENQYKLRGVEVDNARVASIVSLEEETRKLTEAQEAAQRQQEFYKDTLLDGMESLVTGSKSVNEAFRDMIRNMLLDIYRQKVMEPIAQAGSNWLSSLFMANGGAFNKGVQMFADGGVVNAPTAFGHSGGVGVMGEAGPEAIMPLKRGPDGKLGVAGGGNVTVVQNFSFSANGDDSVKRIIAQAAPQIAQMTQKQIMDSRRRGGAMKATFS